MTTNKKIPELRFKEFEGEWEEKKLGQVAKIYDGTHQTPKYTEVGVPFYSVEHVTRNDFTNTKFISEGVFAKENKRVKLEQNDILMTRIGDIGTSKLIDWDVRASFYVSLALIKQHNKFYSPFLNLFIQSNFFKKELHRRTIHVAFPRKINLGEIGKCLLHLPTLPEQQKIASFLTAVDKKIGQLTEQHRLLQSYKKGGMQQLFSQEIRFKADDGSSFGEWEEKRLGEVCSKHSSNISANTLTENEGEFIIYGAAGILKRISNYQDKEPYIGIVKDGAGVGRIVLCEPKTSVLGTLDRLKPKKGVDINFLYSLLLRINFIKYTVGSTIPHIYYRDYQLEKLRLPTLPEQEKIAKFLSGIDEKIEAVSSGLVALRRYKQGLLQGMFV